MISTKSLPKSYQIILGIFCMVNIPLALFGVVWIFTIPIVIPGIALLIWYWKAWMKPNKVTDLRIMWLGTIVYNIALMVGLMCFIWKETPFSWPALGYLVPITMSLFALEALPESAEEISDEVVVRLNWDNEIQADNEPVTARDLIEL